MLSERMELSELRGIGLEVTMVPLNNKDSTLKTRIIARIPTRIKMLVNGADRREESLVEIQILQQRQLLENEEVVMYRIILQGIHTMIPVIVSKSWNQLMSPKVLEIKNRQEIMMQGPQISEPSTMIKHLKVTKIGINGN